MMTYKNKILATLHYFIILTETVDVESKDDEFINKHLYYLIQFQLFRMTIDGKLLALWLINIITAENKSRRLSVVVNSHMVGPKDPTDTLGSFWMPPRFQRAPRNPRVLTPILYTLLIIIGILKLDYKQKLQILKQFPQYSFFILDTKA